jgi:hypothetical protein
VSVVAVRLAAALVIASCGALIGCDGCAKPEREEPPSGGDVRTEDAIAVSAEAAAPPSSACGDVSMASVLADGRCAIGLAQAKALRAALEKDGGKAPLRQDATLTADDHIELRVVNTGSQSLVLPLSFHTLLPAFTVLAEDEEHAIYELEAPRFDVPFAGDSGADRAHFARLVLAPGAFATARIVVGAGVVARLGAKCPDGGRCAPSRLPSGRYTLHVGELLMDVEAGPPARVAWVVR